MLSQIRISKKLEVAVRMLNDNSNLWEITGDRVTLLRNNLSRVTDSNRRTIEEMLEVVDKGERFWVVQAEYAVAIRSILDLGDKPSRRDIEVAIADVRRGSHLDRVHDREWVEDAISLLERMLDSHGELGIDL